MLVGYDSTEYSYGRKYKSGYQLTSKSFGDDPKYDKKWYNSDHLIHLKENIMRNLADHI